MKQIRQLATLLVLALAVAGCGADFEGPGESGSSPAPIDFTANVTAVELANTDTGDIVTVGGLPVPGDTLTKD